MVFFLEQCTLPLVVYRFAEFDWQVNILALLNDFHSFAGLSFKSWKCSIYYQTLSCSLPKAGVTVGLSLVCNDL